MSKLGEHDVPDYLVERLLAGELPEAQAQALRARLERHPGGLDALQKAYAASNEAILHRHPSAQVAAEVRRRAAQSQKVERGRPFLLPALALGAMGAMFLLLTRNEPGTDATHGGPSVLHEGEEVIGIKGMRPHLLVYRKHEGAPQRLSARDPVRPGDVLQLAYVVPAPARDAAPPFGAILSVDAAHAVTLHFPTTPGQAARLQTQGETRLPVAYELDASPGFERFVLVMSPRPFDTNDVAQALERGQPLPSGTTHFELTFLKELP